VPPLTPVLQKELIRVLVSRVVGCPIVSRSSTVNMGPFTRLLVLFPSLPTCTKCAPPLLLQRELVWALVFRVVGCPIVSMLSTFHRVGLLYMFQPPHPYKVPPPPLPPAVLHLEVVRVLMSIVVGCPTVSRLSSFHRALNPFISYVFQPRHLYNATPPPPILH